MRGGLHSGTVCVNKRKKGLYTRQKRHKINDKKLTNFPVRSETTGRANERWKGTGNIVVADYCEH